MIRLMGKSTLALVLLFITAVGLTLALPYKSAVHLALDDSRCAPPCFMGIIPGVTDANDALSLLEANRWVDHIMRGNHEITWDWSGAQPAFIDSDYRGRVSISDWRSTPVVVVNIHIKTRVPFGDLWMVFGEPPQGYIGSSSEQIVHYVSYPQRSFQAVAWIQCPSRPSALWWSSAEIELGRRTISMSDYPSSGWQRYTSCD